MAVEINELDFFMVWGSSEGILCVSVRKTKGKLTKKAAETSTRASIQAQSVPIPIHIKFISTKPASKRQLNVKIELFIISVTWIFNSNLLFLLFIEKLLRRFSRIKIEMEIKFQRFLLDLKFEWIGLNWMAMNWMEFQ